MTRTNDPTSRPRWGLIVAAICLVACTAHAAPLKVCATLPDLGSLVREVGGGEVTLTVFAKGTEDPHFVEALPSFVKALSEADVLVVMGFDFEVGMMPVLLKGARNPTVSPGGRGYVDASTVITPIEVPSAPVDRSMGDVHAYGNPHYLTDPLNGLRVARLLRDRLVGLRPEQRTLFEGRYADFRTRLAKAMIGEALAEKYDFEKVATLMEYGRFDAFLDEQGDRKLLGGWLGRMSGHQHAKVVDDHNIWAYFARRFGIDVIGHMEPRPGIPPTTRHLGELVERMRADHVRVILAAAYYDPRHAQFLAAQTGAKVVPLANQVGARPNASDYLAMVDYNVRSLDAAL
jgi:ABC-type Zn uptake system ZnuABC Zn-binding protein ZnuA